MSRRVCIACRHRYCRCAGPFGRVSIVGATVWGDPSVADLRALCAAKDYELKQLTNAFTTYASTWAAKDSPAELAFLADLSSLRVRYAVARAAADARFADAALSPGIAEKDLSAPDEWNGIIKALRKNWDGTTGGAEAQGDLIDLERRFGLAGGTVDDSNMPQPNPADDASLELFKKADKATRAIDKAVLTGAGALPWVAVVAVAVAVALVARR